LVNKKCPYTPLKKICKAGFDAKILSNAPFGPGSNGTLVWIILEKRMIEENINGIAKGVEDDGYPDVTGFLPLPAKYE